MKKNHILFAGLIFLIALLLCAAASAAPLTTEEILARKANGGTITEEEAAEYLDSLDNMEKAQDLSLGSNYTLDGRIIRINGIPLKVSASDGSNPQTVYVQLENSYYKIADDVILVHDAEGSHFNGRPTAGTKIGLGSGLRVDPGSSTLAEGSKVLLLEKDGSLHAFYAGAGTDSSTLVAGKNLYIMRCFNDMQFHTPNGGVDFPISFAAISFLDGSGYIQAGEDGALNINIDVDSEWDAIWFGPIPIPVYYLYLNDCSLGITLPNLTIHMERYAGWFSVEVPLVEIVEPVAYGFVIDMSPTLSLEGTGEGDTILSVSAREGFNLTITDGAVVSDIGWNHTDPTFDLVDTDMEGDIYYGFSWGPALTWAEVAGFGGFYKVGVVLDAAKSNNDFNPDDKEDLDWHVCGKDNCLEGSAFPRIGPLSANIVLINGMVSIPIISVTEPSDGDTFAEYYISKTFGDKSMSSLCPHKAWRLDVQVVDQAGDPVPTASVFYKDVPEHYEKYSVATTDGTGYAALCTTTGKIEVTAELANPDDPARPFTVSQAIEKHAAADVVVLQLDLPSKHVFFKNPASGEVTDWPEDISFIPAISGEVKLPDTIPALSGRVFAEWNTAEDGSGTSYTPGAKLTLSDDLTLWAQWQIAENSWYVVYNANGGTKAPGPQIVPKGQDAVLTTELPEGGRLIFKGWTPDTQTMDPVYQPGDTLKYDSGKDYVVLYALWDLSPVPEPIHISFSANGLQDAVLPADIWCEMNTWLELEPAFAPVGNPLTFLGWSEDPGAEEPEYQAGRSYYFFRDTHLFAVWDKMDSMTLTFLDSLSDAVSGMPKPITVLPSMSPYVHIPDQIPQKSGRVFTGWNTKKDGSGTAYTPGSVITLRKNTALWAQWEVPVNSWYIVFNANGGTKAPVGQVVPLGEDAVLTKELPEGGKLIFKGWTPDPQAMDPVYQPGDTLKYDSEKSVVVLYALWNLSPVPEPVHISFSANGLQDAVVPADVWFEMGTWLQLEPAFAPVGSPLAFLGWSENPLASSPEFLAGRSYYFYKDTELYAIWEKQDTLTLTFRDSLSDAATGIPDPITIIPSMSRDVKIPDQIPEKSGRIFTGWNTELDGSGKNYSPGSILTLTDDTTLWAQWKVAENSWYVIYNANGGTKAPGPQIVPKGQDAVLTAELPENGELIFRGWTPDLQTMDPVYHPGSTLKYDSGKDHVVLYALWQLSPSERSVIITFMANGGQPDTVPDPLSRPKSTWFLLPESEPSWDAQHLFLGWSDNPEAAEAKWSAGAAAVFDHDTTLYAVWKAQYKVIGGAGSVWVKKSAGSLRFIADGDIQYFVELQIDGKRFMKGVEISSGSTVADIAPWALETLSAGTHTITFLYEDGKATALFFIRNALPPTGDQSNPALWLFLILFGLAGITLVGVLAHSAKKKR